jgi:glycosyltransferase involved in cell wall biosynthesis
MAAALATHRGTWRRVDRFLALTPAVASYLGILGIPSDRVVVKPNSVPDPGPHDRRGTGFLFAGRWVPEKGLGLLLEAWSRHPEGALGPLWIAGGGPLPVPTGRSDIIVLGHLDQAGVREAMRDAAVVVVPSVWDEVCPMVAVEALANARPVLATDRGGLPWLVGDAGWICEPNAAALAEGLLRAHRSAGALSAVARSRYERQFSPTVVTRQLISVYAHLCVDHEL